MYVCLFDRLCVYLSMHVHTRMYVFSVGVCLCVCVGTDVRLGGRTGGRKDAHVRSPV